jgi:4-coumarate--CoA ligase
MLSHRNIVSNVLMLKAGEGGNLSWKGRHNNEGDKLLAFLPFFHIYVSLILYDFPAKSR